MRALIQRTSALLNPAKTLLMCGLILTGCYQAGAVPVRYDFEWEGTSTPPSPEIVGTFTLDLQSSLLGLYAALSFSGSAGGVPWTAVSFSALEGTLPSLLIEFGSSSWRWSSAALGGTVIQPGSKALQEWDQFATAWLASSEFRISPRPLAVSESGGITAIALLLNSVLLLAARRRHRGLGPIRLGSTTGRRHLQP